MSDFKYDGPTPGSTPPGDADLHSSGNPFGAAGLPPIHASEPSAYPPGLPGYFVPPTADPANPYAGGAGSYTAGSNSEGAATDYMASGLSNEAGDNLGNMRGGTGPQPGAADYWQDEGYSRSGGGRS